MTSESQTLARHPPMFSFSLLLLLKRCRFKIDLLPLREGGLSPFQEVEGTWESRAPGDGLLIESLEI